MKKMIVAISIAVAAIFTFTACGSTVQAGLPEEDAVVRALGEDEDTIYIDEEGIALVKQAPVSSEQLVAEIAKALDAVNRERAENGLSPLTFNNSLSDAASVRAQEISKSFSHTRPNGSAWYTVNSRVQYGENLARGYSTAESVVQGWMNSPTHRANILKADFTTIGMAVYAVGNNWYWAQEFGY